MLVGFLICGTARAEVHRFLREIRVDRNSGLSAPPVEPGTLLTDELVRKLADTERELLKQNGYRDPQVEPEIIPIRSEQADLHLHTKPGVRTVVYDVRFTGNPVLPLADLLRALRATRVARAWKVFWIAHPPYTEEGVEEDRASLESFYYARG